MKSIINKIINVLFPKNIHCIICGDELDHDTAICEKCEENLPIISGKVCLRCGQKVNEYNDYCSNCKKRNNEFYFDLARSRFHYTGDIARLIKEIKYDNKKYLFEYLSEELYHCYKEYNISADIIIPVPLHKDRQKIRKYNQAEELCRCISRKENLDIDNTSLIKIKNNVSQTTLSGKERHSNTIDAYSITDNKNTKGKVVLLVDDIYTTGSTANECAKVLKRKGKAKSVIVLTLAHSIENIN